jgi:hypothetical protein
MSRDRTHELKIYANAQHKTAQAGELILHLWFRGCHNLGLDLDIALHRPDVAYVDVIDCVEHTTERLYPNASPAAAPQKRGGRKRKT